MPNTVAHIKFYDKGQVVKYNGKEFVIDCVVIRGYDIFVSLIGHQGRVNTKYIESETTKVDLKRKNDN